MDDFAEQISHDKETTSLEREIVTSPVIQALTLMSVISFLGWGVSGGGQVHPEFVLQPPIAEPWYSALLATYSHINTNHLISNAIVILIAGGIVSLSTSQIRFHVFFIITGVTTSVVQVGLNDMLGEPIATLGASGAAFAFIGYVLASNPISLPIFRKIGTRVLVIVIALASMYITLRLSPPGSALLSHFTGVVLGMIAGRFRLLHTS